MTDRELLELAAKAAGYASWDFLAGEDGNLMNVYMDDGTHNVWWPLEDDGDALRLAMALELGVVCKLESDHYEKDRSVVTNPYCVNQIRIVEPHKGDHFSATRRAIVRAAAAIGERMP